MANAATLRTYPAGTIAINGPARLDRARSTVIPLAILHHKSISSGAKLVYSKLLNYAWAGAAGSNKRLATDLGMSPRAVRNHVVELRKARLLEVQTRPGKPNVYTVSTAI